MTSKPDTNCSPPLCPLCAGRRISDYHRDQRRPYLKCLDCAIVYVDALFHLSPEDEKAQYDLHENDPDDPGYRRFLSRLTKPLLDLLPQYSEGLDFGCGPGPCLSVMLEQQGHSVQLYDLYYANNPALLENRYDFITATEVVEHLAQPGADLNRLWSLLKPGGVLGIMTKLTDDLKSFASWHYKTDPTHISFFSRESFEYLGAEWGATPEIIGADVIIFRKPGGVQQEMLQPNG